MSIHVSRDFISLPNVYLPQTGMYFTAIFIRTVLGYTVVGNTGFDLDSLTFTTDSGSSGQISAGGGFTNRFTPDGHVVSQGDINQILVIKSPGNQLLNSGLWRITGIDTGANQFILGLRGEPPVPEAGLTWRMHVSEASFTFANGANNNTDEYRGRTVSASTARIIMQSAHSTQYQVRLTYETSNDYSSSLVVRQKFTIAPGFGGDSLGDFAVGGNHLHTALWKNQSVNASGAGTVIGLNARDTTAQCRYYFWGDDQTGSVVLITRSVDVVSDCLATFGLPEDEEYPNDVEPIRRLFAVGNASTSNQASGVIDFRSGPVLTDLIGGCAFGYSGQPVFCGVSTYQYFSGQAGNGSGPRVDVTASDNPYLAVTELQTVDLIAGTWDNGNIESQAQDLFLEPRRMGRFPIARLGRANFGDFTTSTDGSRSWLHARNGVYLPWMGSILP